MRTGSFFNEMMGQSAPAEPEVGMGATRLMWTDRHACTITSVHRFKSGPRKGQVKGVVTRADKAVRTDDHGMSDSQSYSYEPDPTGSVRAYTLRSNGKFVHGSTKTGEVLLVGVRKHYYDYSF